MTIPVLITCVLAIFATFATTIFYAEMQTRGIYAPGARKPD